MSTYLGHIFLTGTNHTFLKLFSVLTPATGLEGYKKLPTHFIQLEANHLATSFICDFPRLMGDPAKDADGNHRLRSQCTPRTFALQPARSGAALPSTTGARPRINGRHLAAAVHLHHDCPQQLRTASSTVCLAPAHASRRRILGRLSCS